MPDFEKNHFVKFLLKYLWMKIVAFFIGLPLNFHSLRYFFLEPWKIVDIFEYMFDDIS